MPELIFKKDEDLAKLQGWTIHEAEKIGDSNGVRLVISHPAAETSVEVCLIPTVSLTLSGNTIVHIPGLHITSRDVVKE